MLYLLSSVSLMFNLNSNIQCDTYSWYLQNTQSSLMMYSNWLAFPSLNEPSGNVDNNIVPSEACDVTVAIVDQVERHALEISNIIDTVCAGKVNIQVNLV